MFEWVLNNKEWLFSGLGMAVLGSIYTLVKVIFMKKRREINSVTNPIHNDVNDSKAISEEKPETEVNLIASRFSEILTLMNQNQDYPQQTLSKLSQFMGLEKVSELERIVTGEEEPTFSFVEHFCHIFGVNTNWILNGQGAPFSNNDQTQCYPCDYFEEIEELNPETIFFIRERSDISPAFIILKLNEYKYKILHRIWHVSDEVGNTGQRQLVSLYNLIIKLNNKGYGSKCRGLTTNKEIFSDLFAGKKYPGVFLHPSKTQDMWWDDLVDINHNFHISASYREIHGDSFMKAQEIIRSRLHASKNAS